MAVDGISIRVLDDMSALGQKQTCAAHKPMCKCPKRTFAAAIEMSTKGQKSHTRLSPKKAAIVSRASGPPIRSLLRRFFQVQP